MRSGEFLLGWRGVKPLGLVAVGGDDGDFVGVISGEVGVDKYEEVGDGA